MWWLAQSGSPVTLPNPLDLGAYGVIGIILILLITGWLWPKPAVDNILKKDSEVQALQDEILAVRTNLRRDLAEALTKNQQLIEMPDKHHKAFEASLQDILNECMAIRRELRK